MTTTQAPTFNSLTDEQKGVWQNAKRFFKVQYQGYATVEILVEGGFGEDTAKAIVRKWANECW